MSAYRNFKTVGEMETLVIANLQMYQIIQQEFEMAVVNGFKTYLAQHCYS